MLQVRWDDVSSAWEGGTFHGFYRDLFGRRVSERDRQQAHTHTD